MKRALLLTLLALAPLAAAPAAPDTAEANRYRPCAADFRSKCLIRPHKLITGVHTWVRGIRWIQWNQSTALGFGKLIEPGGATYSGFKAPAKIRLSMPAECQGRQWFWSMTITYGQRFGKTYLRNDDALVPC